MKIWNKLVVAFVKLVAFILKISGRGSATALPGLISERLSNSLLKELVDQINVKIVITGTNGKTTTQTILTSILNSADKSFISNKSGSNLKRGLISTLIRNSNLFGKLAFDFGIFELEEATMPKVIEDINPDIIIVTNLYRDQLDAYGEVDRTQNFIRSSIEKCPNATLILNADDARVNKLGKGLSNKTIFYGIEEEKLTHFKYEVQVENNRETKNVVRAKNIFVNPDLTSSFKVNGNIYEQKAPGIFHVYNALAAILTSEELEISQNIVSKGVTASEPAFGRGELISKDNINYKVLLVKNPAGMTLSLNLVKNIQNSKLIFILNDNIADGRDVSWIWDSEMEILNQIKPTEIIVSGIRAEDMLLRVKYALGQIDKTGHNIYVSKEIGTKIKLIKDINEVHRRLRRESGDYYYVFPTYTAMLQFRKSLTGNALNE